MNFEKAFTKQLAIRQKKLAEAKHEWIMIAHEKGIALLVKQRMCNHIFSSIAINGKSTIIQKCKKCKFTFLGT